MTSQQTSAKSSANSSEKPAVNIHCDGSCSGNPGPGGWAAILTKPGTTKKRIISGKSNGTTTNNKMELQAAIEGLSALKMPCKVTLFTDSDYLVKTMTKGWKRNSNTDQWEKLDKLAETHQITWIWLKRNSTPELEECDQLAKEQSKL